MILYLNEYSPQLPAFTVNSHMRLGMGGFFGIRAGGMGEEITNIAHYGLLAAVLNVS